MSFYEFIVLMNLFIIGFTVLWKSDKSLLLVISFESITLLLMMMILMSGSAALVLVTVLVFFVGESLIFISIMLSCLRFIGKISGTLLFF